MRKRILFLDDDDVRHHHWKERLAKHHDVDYARTMEEYIQLLNENRYDIVSLDHDLNENQHLRSSKLNTFELNGCHAAAILTWLPPELRPECVVIHSWNRVGADQMELILLNAGIHTIVKRFDTATYIRVAEERYQLGHKDRMFMAWMRYR